MYDLFKVIHLTNIAIKTRERMSAQKLSPHHTGLYIIQKEFIKNKWFTRVLPTVPI